LQALAGLPCFMSFLQKLCEMFMEDSRLEARIPELLNNTLLYLNNHEHDTLNPKELIEALRDKVDFKFYQERQDSHELLKLLMDDVDSSLKEKTHDLSRSINPFKTITDEQEQDLINPFNGYIAQVLICDKCKRESNTKVECFNDLSLIIKEAHINDLASAFDNYFRPETVDDVECLGCSITALIQKKNRTLQSIDGLEISNEMKCKYSLDTQEQIEYLKKAQKMPLLEHKDLSTIIFEVKLYVLTNQFQV